MTQLIVLSAIGRDRTGIVQDITEVILNCGGNIEESRMTTLGAEFAMLMLVSGNWHTLNRLEKGLEKLDDGDLTFTIRKTGERPVKEDRMPYAVDVVSLDHEGIVYNLANFFAPHNIDIADVATRIEALGATPVAADIGDEILSRRNSPHVQCGPKRADQSPGNTSNHGMG